MSVIKASQKATGRDDHRGKQSLEGVLRSRLSWIKDGHVDEERLKQLAGKFNASRRNGDPKVYKAAQSYRMKVYCLCYHVLPSLGRISD